MDAITGASGAVGAVSGGGLVWWLINRLDRARDARLGNIEEAIKALDAKVDTELKGMVSKEMCGLNMDSSGKDLKSLECLLAKAQKANEKEHGGLAATLQELRGYQIDLNKTINALAIKLASNGAE